jgi:hypothetical protein
MQILGNSRTCYILYWFIGCCLFTGSLVASYCCLVQLFKVEVLHLQLDLLVLSC